MLKYNKFLKAVLFSGLILFSSGLVLTSCLYLYLSPKLPSVEELSEIELQIPLRIYSNDLKIIAEFGEKKRSPVSFQEIPNTMVNAFLAAEDSSFFEHSGIAISGLARAALELARTGSIRSGWPKSRWRNSDTDFVIGWDVIPKRGNFGSKDLGFCRAWI